MSDDEPGDRRLLFCEKVHKMSRSLDEALEFPHIRPTDRRIVNGKRFWVNMSCTYTTSVISLDQ